MKQQNALPTLPMHVVATAGHVDHGKSTLVRALTGADPDRWAEEKQRGLTIDLGFAWTALPGAGEVSFVDVPGHVRFLSNMLAGVAVIEAALLCVDAHEGWRAQTEEHLQILDLIGVPVGLVVLTKVGSVSDDRVEAAREEVRQRTKGTVLAEAPIVACDSVEGSGLDELRDQLARLLVAQEPPDLSRPRLWVDRSFTMAGSGTVVTGGVGGGALTTDDGIEVIGARGRLSGRVRGIQALGRAVQEAAAGSRAALNLAGIDRRAVRRGDAVVRPGQWQPTSRVGATLRVLDSLDHDVTTRGAYLLNVGSGEHAVRLELPGVRRVAPGDVGEVRLSLSHPLPLAPGDHYVLRETGRGEIVGGGEILDLAPPRGRSAHSGQAAARDEITREYDWLKADELERRFGVVAKPVVDEWVVSQETLNAARTDLVEKIDGARPIGLDIDQLGERERVVAGLLEREGLAEPVAGYILRPAWRDELADDPYMELIERFLYSPPTPDEAEVPSEVLRALLRRGLVVVKGGTYFAASALTSAKPILRALSEEREEGFTASEARQALGTTRKWVIPLLELLDEARITVRHGDRRFVRAS